MDHIKGFSEKPCRLFLYTVSTCPWLTLPHCSRNNNQSDQETKEIGEGVKKHFTMAPMVALLN
jgi:hypothetical protein